MWTGPLNEHSCGGWSKVEGGLRRGCTCKQGWSNEPYTDEGALVSLTLFLSLSLCHSPDCRLMDDDKRQKVHVSSLTEPHKLYYIFYIKKNCLCKHFETFAKNVFFESCCRLSPSRSHLCLLFRLRPECIKLSFRLARVLTFSLT